MKDSLGGAQSLLILGGTSDIALATARAMVAGKTRRVVLAARPSERLDAAAEQLRGLGAEVETVAFDAGDVDTHEKALTAVFEAGDVDVVLLAFGVLGNQASDEQDPVAAAKVAQTNYVGAVSSGLVCATALRKQGHGSLVVLSSVAGERARKANFIYGSTKAGLDAFTQGLEYHDGFLYESTGLEGRSSLRIRESPICRAKINMLTALIGRPIPVEAEIGAAPKRSADRPMSLWTTVYLL